MQVQDSLVFEYIKKQINENIKTTWGKNELLYQLLKWEVDFIRSLTSSSVGIERNLEK